MSEDSTGVSIGDADGPIDWGNADGDRGIIDDTLDIGKDFGKDMEWAGESIANTWDTASDRIDEDASHDFGAAKDDFEQGDYLGAAGEAGWGALQVGGDFTAGVIGTAADALGGLGAGVVAVGHDVLDVAEDVGEDVVDGVESAASAVGDAVGSVIDDIEDLF